MLLVISPAKSLNLELINQEDHTIPQLLTDANRLSRVMKKKTPADLMRLMSISDNIAKENVRRFKEYKVSPSKENSKRAIDTFNGDVYRGLSVSDFTNKDYKYAQKYLRILSGLYGLLRPLDLIQPYRLEMGTSLVTDKGRTLYKYWGNKITNKMNKAIAESESDALINLASNEYFKSINRKKLKARLLNINFKEDRNGEIKFISFTAKVARGMMARYVIKNQLNKTEDLKGFSEDGYFFSEEHSTENSWIFIK